MELEDGRPVNVGTYLDATCEDGQPWRARWWSFEGWTGQREHSLVARVDDEGVRGTMTFAETQRRGSDSYACASGRVSFSAG